jgi:hypothetical protein
MTTFNQDLFEPTQLVLAVSETTLQESWDRTQNAATPNSHWQAYLNLVTLNAFRTWFKIEFDRSIKVDNAKTLGNIWEVVNGTPLQFDDCRIVLIPAEAEDLSELRVPQEWVDLPQWCADYYLAAQVNVDSGYVRIWSYCTHQQLKTQGNYSPVDRTYTLNDTDLIADMEVFWVARELCPDEVTRTAVEAIPEISSVQAANLIQRLGNPEQLLPRLAIPFQLWGALIQNDVWCQQLAQQRRGIAPQASVWEWLQTGIDNLAAELGWRSIEFQPSFVGARGTDVLDRTVGIAKHISIEGQPYELKILLLELQASENIWRFELRSLSLGGMIPAGFSLKLLTEGLQSFEDNEDFATTPVEQLELELGLQPGEKLVWQIEPTPDNYVVEVLQF